MALCKRCKLEGEHGEDRAKCFEALKEARVKVDARLNDMKMKIEEMLKEK